MSLTNRMLTRRAALLGGAGASIALPLFDSWRDRLRGAHAAAPPKRLLVFCNVHGTFPERFWPTPKGGTPFPATRLPDRLYSSGNTALDTTDFTFSPILEPLAAHKQQLLILEGIDNIDGQEGHRNLGALLTGWAPLTGQVGKGTSVDQVIAARASTRIPSLQLGVKVGQRTDSYGCLSWYDTGKPAPAQNSPKQVWDRLFAGGVDQTALDRIRSERRLVIDAALEQSKSLEPTLSAEDRLKLQGHLASFAEVERRLTSLPDRTCQAPTAPSPGTGDDAIPIIGQTQMDLAVAALACDLTRVVTLQYGHEGTVIRHPWLTGDEPHHTVSHAGNSNLAGYEKIAKVQRWYAEQFALLLDKLKAVPEGGGTMLDHTLVLWVNAMTKGNEHHNWNTPCVLAGNLGGAFRMGRYVRLPRDPSVRYQGRNKFVRGRSFNDLSVTLLRAFGIEASTFGDPYFFNGPLDATLRA